MPAARRGLDQVRKNPRTRGRRVIVIDRKGIFQRSLVAAKAELEDHQGVLCEVDDASLSTLEGVRQVARRPRTRIRFLAPPGEKVGISARGCAQNPRISRG